MYYFFIVRHQLRQRFTTRADSLQSAVAKFSNTMNPYFQDLNGVHPLDVYEVGDNALYERGVFEPYVLDQTSAIHAFNADFRNGHVQHMMHLSSEITYPLRPAAASPGLPASRKRRLS